MRGAADTIFAVASGNGRAAVAVLRISGPAAGRLIGQLAGRLPKPRHASLRRLRHDGETLDRALVLWFPGPGSYTGEDCAELHLHGGRAVVDGVAEALAGLGARPADAGEFTRRAFLHGKMDLPGAEAVADVIDADTAEQRRQALRQLDGALGRVLNDWRERLTRLLAWQEALIDFPDENLPPDVEARLTAEMAALESEMRRALRDGRRGSRLRDGLVFAVAGAPNAGKSTLVNALATREVAIVSPLAGTTRDVLEVTVDLGGVPVTLLDTAGLREAGDAIEAEGIRRARARMAQADLIIEVRDASNGESADLAEAMLGDASVPRLVVWTKGDLADPPGQADCLISAVSGAGMPALQHRLVTLARELTDSGGAPALTRARHRAALEAATEALAQAQATLMPELRGEDLRAALHEIGRVTGHVGVEDVLDVVFGAFCIGK